MKSIIVSNVRRKQIIEMIAKEKRLDGRGLYDYRPIQIESGVIERAEGSARVKLGKTEVLVGIKIGIGKPFPDRPNNGALTVNAEFAPLASPEFETGPPREAAIELARVVDRGIRESEAIDLEKLCLIPGKKVFVVYIDVYIINHDGNLIDASSLAALAALKNTKIFRYEIEDEEIKIKPGLVKLSIKNFPVSITFAKINGKLIVDPWIDEERVMDSRLTMTFDAEGKICAIQKGGAGVLTLEQILQVAKKAKEKAEENRKLVVKD
jgi:exosome complex component RRP42